MHNLREPTVHAGVVRHHSEIRELKPGVRLQCAATAVLPNFSTSPPRYMRPYAKYSPRRGSHLTITEAGSKQEGDDVRLELSDIHVQRTVVH